MVKVRTKKVGEKSVKKHGSSLEKTPLKRKRIGQERKNSVGQIISREKGQRKKKAVNKSAIKKRTSNKIAKSKVAVQKKSLKKNLYKGGSKEDTLKTGKGSEIGAIEKITEEISQKPKLIDQKKIPILEAKNFLKKCLNRYRDLLVQSPKK